jgi:tellurite methyltransferase
MSSIVCVSLGAIAAMGCGENKVFRKQLMPTQDATRWNLRYREDSRNIFEPPRTLLVDHSETIPTCGLALDIAMGLGNNTNYLLKRGLRVIGVDISLVALSKVKRKLPNLLAVVADLERFYIPENTFDVIISFLYLQTNLWLPMTRGLKMGGVMFIECLTEEMLSIHPEINPVFLLKSGELQRAFSLDEIGKYLEIIYYYEGWQSTESSHPRAVACLIARRVV